MQVSSPQRRTFAVCLKAAYLLVDSLRVMKEMTSSGDVDCEEWRDPGLSNQQKSQGQCVAGDGGFDCFLLEIRLFCYSIRYLRLDSDSPFTGYSAGERIALGLPEGNDCSPFKLGEAKFVQERGMDVENLVSHPVTVELKS